MIIHKVSWLVLTRIDSNNYTYVQHDEFYQSEPMAKIRVEEIKEQLRVLGIADTRPTIFEVEVK